MRRIRFIHKKISGRFAWQSLIYFRPEPKKPGVDFEDCRLESATDFGTEAEAKADNERVESKLGLKV